MKRENERLGIPPRGIAEGSDGRSNPTPLALRNPLAEPGVLAEALADLPMILAGLRDALERQTDNRPRIEPMALRPEDLEVAIGVDNRTIQRWRSVGKFPRPDVQIGRTLLWKPQTIRDWLDSQAPRRGGRP